MPIDESTPSSRRPLPFRRRTDLIVRRIGFQGSGYWVVKDPVGLRYNRLRDEQYSTLELLDGEISLYALRAALCREYPTSRPTLEDVQRLVVNLHERGLVTSDRRGQGPALLKRAEEERWKKFRQGLKNVLFLRLPGWDPDRALTAMLPWTGWVFRPWAVALAGLFVISSLLLLLVQFDEFRGKLPEFEVFFGWSNLFYLWIVLACTKVLHEFGHGIACRHFGSECHEMGVMLLVFSPTLYCDTTDSWMLRNKWQRMAIGAGGMYFEAVLSAFALWLWWFSADSALGHLCLNVFFVTSVTTVVFNLNPLMRFDGYYILSDYLEIPNLRPHADRMLKQTFDSVCLGIEPHPDPFEPTHGRLWFVLFAIAAWIYRWFLVVGIALFLYTVLKPYSLQSIGIAMAVFSIGGILIGMVVSLFRTLRTPREEPLSRTRIVVTLLVVAGLVAACMSIPVPLHVEAPFVLQPRDVHHVHATTSGRLVAIEVEPGHVVEVGDELLLFENQDLSSRLLELELEADVLAARLETSRAIRDFAAEATAREALESARRQVEETKRRLGRLVVTAPVAGRVVSPPPRPEPKLDETITHLPLWHGSPLEERNLGATFDEGTELLSIAPTEDFDAVLYVDQSIRNDVAAGRFVELKFDELPMEIFESEVASISDRHDAFVPSAMSNKFGGELPTLTNDQGQERLVDPAYRIVVPLRQVHPSFRSDLRGRARFLVSHRTLGQWIWRSIRRTFQFEL